MSAILMQLIALVLGFVLWAFLVYLKLVPAEPLIALLQMGLGGLVTHMLKGVGETSAASKQGGFASVRMMIMIAGMAAGVAMLSGCAALTEAGNTAYTFEASALGCKATANDGKEFKARTIIVDCAKGHMAIDEGESKAFKGQAISAKAAAVFPVTDLANIISGDGK